MGKSRYFTVSQNSSTNIWQGLFYSVVPGMEHGALHLPAKYFPSELLSLTKAIVCKSYSQWPWFDCNYSSWCQLIVSMGSLSLQIEKTILILRKHVWKCPCINPAPSKNNREIPRFSFCPECSLYTKRTHLRYTVGGEKNAGNKSSTNY